MGNQEKWFQLSLIWKKMLFCLMLIPGAHALLADSSKILSEPPPPYRCFWNYSIDPGPQKSLDSFEWDGTTPFSRPPKIIRGRTYNINVGGNSETLQFQILCRGRGLLAVTDSPVNAKWYSLHWSEIADDGMQFHFACLRH